MSLATHKRSLPNEELEAIWITPELKRQIRTIAAFQKRTQNDVAEQIVRAGLTTLQTRVESIPVIPVESPR